MDDTHDGAYAREPQIADLVRICRALNEAGARYLLIGGFAVIAHGGSRTTKDIDLLIDASTDNVVRVKRALRVLEDHAADDVAETDVAQYTVVRVAEAGRGGEVLPSRSLPSCLGPVEFSRCGDPLCATRSAATPSPHLYPNLLGNRLPSSRRP